MMGWVPKCSGYLSSRKSYESRLGPIKLSPSLIKNSPFSCDRLDKARSIKPIKSGKYHLRIKVKKM
jgi:hypothetical protein